MDVDDDDRKSGDDPLGRRVPTGTTEKRKLNSKDSNKIEDGVDSKRNKTTQGISNKLIPQKQNDSTKSQNKTKEQISLNTGTTQKMLDKPLQLNNNNKDNKDKDNKTNRDKIDTNYNDGWIKNTDYTIFVIEKENNDQRTA